MLIRDGSDIRSAEITPLRLYLDRRQFLAGVAASAILAPTLGEAAALTGVVAGPFSTDEEPTPKKSATSYNNFYELGPDKEDPERNAGLLRTRPWAVVVDGACARPGTLDLDTLIRPHRLEERIYRLRCVEGWSMVIPWIGFPLADLLRRVEPTSAAKFVGFTTLYAPEMMPGQRMPLLSWPYTEGLRIDEAMHPLTMLAVGMYGAELPAQNGAPLRLVVPWKYGFKSIKSIVRISLVEHQPPTSWNLRAPNEYGFYANVNPAVDHPRWSQAKERRIGEFFRRPTLPFNGYGDQVAGLYAGMDLQRFF